MRTLIVNFKNYPEVFGDGSVRLAHLVKKTAEEIGVVGISAPPSPLLGLVSARTGGVVFSQSVGSVAGDRTTGEVVPEAVISSGAAGTLLNHSEARKTKSEIKELLPRLSKVGLEVCLCAQTAEEAAVLSRLGPKYIAVEPPELIGTGVAVSKARPELIRKTVDSVRKTGYRGQILCGAGILTGEDVGKAVELGSDGVLVSSAVVKAKDQESKLRELARSLT